MTVPTGSATANVVLSPADLERVERVERLARSGAVGVPDLLELLVDPSWAVRRAVVGALATAGELAAEGLCDILVNRRDHEARLAASVDALVASRSAIEPRLIALAGSDVAAATVCDVLHVLGRRRTRAAVPIISRLASHADDNVAVSAIEALASIGGVDTVDALVASIDARHFFRTFPAIDALGRTGDARALDSLAALLADPLYAAEAARALGRTGQESAVAPLAGLLSSDAMWLVRSGAVALAELRERYEATFGESLTIQR